MCRWRPCICTQLIWTRFICVQQQGLVWFCSRLYYLVPSELRLNFRDRWWSILRLLLGAESILTQAGRSLPAELRSRALWVRTLLHAEVTIYHRHSKQGCSWGGMHVSYVKFNVAVKSPLHPFNQQWQERLQHARRDGASPYPMKTVRTTHTWWL